jgi:hypothetical protein
MEKEHGIVPNIARNISLFPEVSSEQLPQLAKLNALLWRVADEIIASGRPVEQVAQGPLRDHCGAAATRIGNFVLRL